MVPLLACKLGKQRVLNRESHRHAKLTGHGRLDDIPNCRRDRAGLVADTRQCRKVNGGVDGNEISFAARRKGRSGVTSIEEGVGAKAS